VCVCEFIVKSVKGTKFISHARLERAQTLEEVNDALIKLSFLFPFFFSRFIAVAGASGGSGDNRVVG
jgi:hypothetical protein